MKTNYDEISGRIDRIARNPFFRQNMSLLAIKEKRRKYCRHDMRHLLDTARIAYILNLENNLGLKKDVVYAAALLHDVGKIVEYVEGMEHHVVSAELCVEILKEAQFSDEEIQMIRKAILMHRETLVKSEKSLSGIIYRADKLSRPCFSCKTEPKCDWSPDKKNINIIY